MSNVTNISMAANAESTTTFNKLSEAEFKTLLARSKSGDNNARNQLLLDNMGLIYKIAAQIKNPNASREDLVSDGCIRFLEIIDEYNPDTAALSTYIWRPIMQYMNKNIAGFKAGLGQFIGSYKEAVSELFDKFGRQPVLEEIADFMGISLKVLKARLSDIEVRSSISLDAPLESDNAEAVSLKDSALCATSYDASSSLIEQDERNCINIAWSRLSEEDRNILSFRTNTSGKKMSLRDAAKVTGLCTETIRQRELQAKKHFQNYLEEYGVMAA